jgi:hypothetical protein
VIPALFITFLTFLGSGIAFRLFKKVELLAGYDDEKVADRDGLAVWVGNVCLPASALYAIALLILYAAAIDLQHRTTMSIVFGFLFASVLGAVIAMMAGTRRFMK